MLVGDLMDNGTRSSVTGPYEQTENPMEQRKIMTRKLESIKDRILAGISGNHEARSRKGDFQDPMEMLMESLGLEHLYREGTAFLNLDLWGKNKRSPGKGLSRPKYCIAVNHGSSSGATPGAGINKMLPIAISWGVDFMISGHTHKPAIGTGVRLEPDTQKGILIPREVKVMVATSWLDYGGYAMVRPYQPSGIFPNYAVLSSDRKHIRVIQD